jgi:isopenicillin N synthase-like dioxygenase
MNHSGPVPLIDIGAYTSGTAASTRLARQVDEACRELGFLIIANHGLDESVVQACWDQSTRFFDSDPLVRDSARAPNAGHPYGYHGFAAEALAGSLGDETPPDLKETFNVGPLEQPLGLDPDSAAFAYAANHWPEGEPAFRQALEAYYRALGHLADRVLEVFAAALGLDARYFVDFFRRPMSALRVINYPEQAAPPAPGQLRAGAHTDYGTLTLLMQQEGIRGLQVFSRGAWHDVPAVPGTLVVNIGDLMARWTNDRWVSTLHRVVNPPGDETGSNRRQSLVFFHTPDWDAEISAIPTCVPKGTEPVYRPVMAGPHLAAKFNKTVHSGYGKKRPVMSP